MRQALLKHIRGRVHNPGIDIAHLGKGKEVGRVFAGVENVGAGLVNRYRSGVRIGIRCVSGMQSLGAKAIVGLV